MCVLKPPSSAYSITEAVQLWQRRLYAPVAVGAISVLRRCFVVSLWFFFVFVFVLSSHYCCAMITMILMARSFLRLPPSDWLLSVAAVFELFSRFVLVERGNNWMDSPPPHLIRLIDSCENWLKVIVCFFFVLASPRNFFSALISVRSNASAFMVLHSSSFNSLYFSFSSCRIYRACKTRFETHFLIFRVGKHIQIKMLCQSVRNKQCVGVLPLANAFTVVLVRLLEMHFCDASIEKILVLFWSFT